MEIKKIAISTINPAPYNPRVDLTPQDPEYKKLKNSMETFGYVDPLVWNAATGNLVGGHQRLKILLAQGVNEVDVSVVNLSPEKEKMLNLALNKISGKWDADRLSLLVSELSAMPDLNITLTGFDYPEISAIMDRIGNTDERFDFNAVLDAIKEPVTKPGDIIELGRHRILCGDASDPTAYGGLIGADRIDIIHTDPPYNINYKAGQRPSKNKRKTRWEEIRQDNQKQNDYETWLKRVFEAATPYVKTSAPFYIWNGFRQFGHMQDMLGELGFTSACIITWAKPSFGLSYADYNPQTEFCLYGWKSGKGAHKWYGPANESTLWEIGRDSMADYIHPTQKPVAAPLRALRNSSIRDGALLDMFLGSGSTLIAAEMLGRRCFGLELDPKYCDAIVKRYLTFTGDRNPQLDKYRMEVNHA